MMKRFALLVLIFTLLLSAVAEAKFSDEYKAKYPRRVKTETRAEWRQGHSNHLYPF